MSVSAGLYRASQAEISKLLEEPASIREFFERATWAPPVREVRPKGPLGWLLKLSPVKVFENDPDAEPPSGYNPADDRPHCDLEGVWHALHFLFTGTAWEGDGPASYLLRGGQAIGDADDLGYSVLQAFGPRDTRRFADFLGSLSRDDLDRRFDPKRMTELGIDPGSWTTHAADDTRFQHLLEAYGDLRAFVQASADANAGLVIYVG